MFSKKFHRWIILVSISGNLQLQDANQVRFLIFRKSDFRETKKFYEYQYYMAASGKLRFWFCLGIWALNWWILIVLVGEPHPFNGGTSGNLGSRKTRFLGFEVSWASYLSFSRQWHFYKVSYHIGFLIFKQKDQTQNLLGQHTNF